MYYYSRPQKNAILDDNLIVFRSEEQFTNSPLVFWEYITKNTDYKTAWIVATDDMRQRLSDAGILCCTTVDYGTVDKFLSTAKYVVLDGRLPTFWEPYEGQLIIHCSAATHFSRDVFLADEWPEQFNNTLYFHKYNGAEGGIFTASSFFTKTATAAQFGVDARKIFVTGVPRTDAIFTGNGKDILVSQFPKLKEYRRLILYTPGPKAGLDFGMSIGKYSQNIFNLNDFNQDHFEKHLESYNAAVIFKMHPFDEFYFKSNPLPTLPKHCYLIHSNSFFGKTLHHIYNAFDFMISDASSTAFEYLLIDKPIVYLHNEFEYMARRIQFIIDDETILFPGSRSYTFKEFMDSITEAFDYPHHYQENRRLTRDILHTHHDGKSCERLLKLVRNYKAIENIDYNMYTVSYRQQLEVVNGQLYTTRQDLIDTQQNLSDTQQNLSDTQQNLSDTQQNLSDTQQNLSDTQRDLSDTQQNLSDTQQNLSDTQQNLSDTQRELIDTQRDLIDRQRELSDTQQNLFDTQRDLSDTQRELSDTQRELSDTQRELSDTQRELSDTQRDLSDTQRELSDTQRDLSDTQRELSDTQRDLSDTQQNLADTQQNLYIIQKNLTVTQETLAVTQQTLYGILSSRSYRILRKSINVFCPPGGVRHKFVRKCISMLNNIRRRWKSKWGD